MNPYGETKALSERLLPWFEAAHGIRSAALRYFNAAGAAEDGSRGEDWTDAPEPHPGGAADGRRAAAVGPRSSARTIRRPTERRSATTSTSSTWPRPIAARSRRSTRRDASLTVNVGTGVGASVLEVLDAARRITGRPIPAEAAPRREGDPPADLGRHHARPEDCSAGVRRASSTTSCGSAWRWHTSHPDGYGGERLEPAARRGSAEPDDAERPDRRLRHVALPEAHRDVHPRRARGDGPGRRPRSSSIPLLRQTGEPVQPAAVRWVERAHYLPFLSPPILRSQWSFLRDPPPAAALPPGVRRHAPRDVAQPELPRWAGSASSRRSPHMPLGDASTTGVDHVHCHFANHPALAGWLDPSAGRASRTASRRTAPTSTSTGRCSPTKVARGGVRRDDLAATTER